MKTTFFDSILKRDGLVILIIWAAVFVPNLNVLEVNIMEARNFITAREMLHDGNWILTRMNGLPRYEKPPLPTWITAGFAKIFGLQNIFMLRFAAALMTLLLFFALRKLMRHAGFDKPQTLLSVLILATAFSTIFTGREATWDIYAHAFMLLGIACLFQLFEKTDQNLNAAFVAGICIGFSFLSKGPVSHFALLLPFLIAYGIVYRFKKSNISPVAIIFLVLIALLISSWWPFYIYLFDENSAEQIAEVESNAWLSNNVRPLYYYFDFFTELGIWTIPAFMSLWYPYMKKRVSNLKLYQFSLLWTVIGVVLLSLIPEKKKRYLFPVMIPLAITTSFYLQVAALMWNKFSKTEKWPLRIHYWLLIVVCFAFPVAAYFLLQDAWQEYIVSYILTSLFLIGIGVLKIYWLQKKLFDRLFYTNVLVVATIVVFGISMVGVFYDNKEIVSPKVIASYEAKYQTKSYSYGEISPEIIWDYGFKLPQYDRFVNPPFFEKATFLVNEKMESKFLATFEKDYRIESLEHIDINYADKSRKNHKSRLTANLYLLTQYDSQ
ncbi:MAG: glycosyltransferase family 39 protein [Flavobacteriaceae bacterium]|nr:glycosyltransferase family 39 protein [Flavobacteriaceae bacterium]